LTLPAAPPSLVAREFCTLALCCLRQGAGWLKSFLERTKRLESSKPCMDINHWFNGSIIFSKGVL
jgi:hypothetical protein